MADTKGLFINGQWVRGQGTELVSRNPADGEPVWRGSTADSDQVNAAMDAARRAFDSWSRTSSADRAGLLERFHGELKAHKTELAEAVSMEVGKPLWESLQEIDAMAAKIDVSLDAYQERCPTVVKSRNNTASVLRYKPHGVVAVVGPFNFPGHLPNGHIVPALLAGNVVVFKPSSRVPAVAVKTAELWEAAGIPPGVFNLVLTDSSSTDTLVEHPALNGLFFTGSNATGRAIHRKFAGHPERILALEMGGNSPLVVWDVKDLESAALVTVQSAFITSGQRCTCARRLIVPDDERGAAFLKVLSSLTKRIRVGRYDESPEPFMGPVIGEEAADKLMKAQTNLRSSGGSSLVPMERLDRKGAFLSPGILDVTEVSQRPDEELFGPLLQVVRVGDVHDALREADRTRYGLAAGLLSDSRELYERFLSEIHAGVVNWNQPTTGASSRMPFGGVGASGNHRPSAYFAADYCSYPVASSEAETVPQFKPPPGIQ